MRGRARGEMETIEKEVGDLVIRIEETIKRDRDDRQRRLESWRSAVRHAWPISLQKGSSCAASKIGATGCSRLGRISHWAAQTML